MTRRLATHAGKTIYDPVHGSVHVDGVALSLIGLPAFQRLWGIRQTGFAHLVFPGANQTRLEHSLGTFHVARQMADRLGLRGRARMEVVAAALLHDIGHAPFSHTLDGPMAEVIGEGHEAISRAWITGDGPASSKWRNSDGPTIPELLEREGARPSATAALVDPGRGRVPSLAGAILHGAIDADRLDYLQRDAHYTGVAHGAIDAVRLLDTLESEGDRLVFAEKGRSAVEGFLVGRSLMYASVYYHKTVRAGEIMAQAAVERLAGYPESARSLFFGTDGELLVELGRSGGISERLVRSIEVRALYKRAWAARSLSKPLRLRLEQLLRRPDDRRAVEDRLAEGLGRTPGEVLLDLSGVRPRLGPGDGWEEVGIREDDRVRYPFRSQGPWHHLAARPPSPWSLSVYVHPRARATARRRLPGLLRRVL